MTSRIRQRLLACSLAASLLVVSTGTGQEGQEEGQDASLNRIQNSAPSFLVRAEVNRKSRNYRHRDTLTIRAVSEVDGYLYALYQQADGKIYQIFPNSVQTDNRVKARQPVELPTSHDRFRWTIGPPFGAETLKLVVSKRPVARLSEPELRRRLFNAVAKDELKGMEVELERTRPSDWAEFDIKIHTYAGAEDVDKTATKRFGVFFGVTHYEFNAEYEIAHKGKRSLNLPTCHRDANQLAELMKAAGRLNEVQIRTNEHATRAELEDCVTRWLPSVSKPGDTVFIYFSGHGLQIADDNADEKDRRDEILATHDFAGPSVMSVMLKQYKDGKLEARQVVRLQELLKIAGYTNQSSRPGTVEELGQRLARGTGVSDDLFGHWLQSLDGRRIVVLLDICHAGGFATLEKSLREEPTTKSFDFMDREFARLKDIGQRDSALLASSSATNTSQIRSDRFPQDLGPLSVMTSYLIDALVTADGVVTLKDAFRHCNDGMAAYFQQKPEGSSSHRPIFFNDLVAPVYLKP